MLQTNFFYSFNIIIKQLLITFRTIVIACIKTVIVKLTHNVIGMHVIWSELWTIHISTLCHKSTVFTWNCMSKAYKSINWHCFLCIESERLNMYLLLYVSFIELTVLLQLNLALRTAVYWYPAMLWRHVSRHLGNSFSFFLPCCERRRQACLTDSRCWDRLLTADLERLGDKFPPWSSQKQLVDYYFRIYIECIKQVNIMAIR